MTAPLAVQDDARPACALGTAPLTAPARLLLGALLAVAALVHLALAPEHYREQPVFGAFFAVAGAAQLFLARDGWSATA